MDSDRLRELRIAVKKADLHWRQDVAAKSGKAAMSAQTYQMLKIRLAEAEKETK